MDDHIVSLVTRLRLKHGCRDSPELTAVRAALLDAKVQVEERVALTRYRAFVERVAGLVERDIPPQRDDLTGYQLDGLVTALETRISKDTHMPFAIHDTTTEKKPMTTINLTSIPTAYETAKAAVVNGLKRGAVTVLVMSVRRPTVRLITKTLGKQAGAKANAWLNTNAGEAVFSVAVGGIGLGAQALGITGKLTDKVNALCGEAITQGIHGGAKAILSGALGEIFAAYTEAAAKIEEATGDSAA